MLTSCAALNPLLPFRPRSLHLPKRNSEVHQFVRFVAHGNNPGVRIRYPAALVLVLGHIVDDVLLRLLVLRARRVHRADQVHLVVLELEVVPVHVDDVVRVVDPEDRVRGVPVYRVELRAARHRRHHAGM